MSGGGFLDVVARALSATPAARQIVAEARAAGDAKRAEAHSALWAAWKEREAAMAPLQVAEAVAREDLSEARQAMAVAERRMHEAWQARVAAAQQHESRINRLERELVALAPPELGRFLTYLGAVEAGVSALPLPWGLDRDARLRVVELVRAARARVDEMQRSATASPKLVEELAKLRSGIESAARKLSGQLGRDVEATRNFEVVSGPEAA